VILFSLSLSSPLSLFFEWSFSLSLSRLLSLSPSSLVCVVVVVVVALFSLSSRLVFWIPLSVVCLSSLSRLNQGCGVCLCPFPFSLGQCVKVWVSEKQPLSLLWSKKHQQQDDDTKSLLPPPPTKTTKDKKVKEIKRNKSESESGCDPPEGTPLLLAFFCLLLFPPLSLILSQLMSPLAPKVRPCIQILQLMSHDKHTFHPFSYIITFFIVKGSKISMIDIQIVFWVFYWCEMCNVCDFHHHLLHQGFWGFDDDDDDGVFFDLSNVSTLYIYIW
jgi:hypothetical protein